MPEVFCVDAVGVRVGIDLERLDADAIVAVKRAWADAASPADGIPTVTVRPSPTSLENMLSSLSQQVTLAAINAARGRAWMLHAAGVAGEDGDVVVLVGPSGRGKTTASRALGRVFGYVSDETVAIDEDGAVRPYRKPLSVIEDRARPKVQVAPTDAGLQPLPDAPLRVRAIVLLDRDPAHEGGPVLEPVDLGDALEELVAQSSFLVHADAPLRFMAAVAEATGGVRQVRYREAADLVPVIGELLAPGREPVRVDPVAPAEGMPSAAALDAAVPDAPPAPGPRPAPRFSRAAWADHVELHDPDRVAILTVDGAGTGTVRVIAGVAPALWRAADGATLAELTDAAVAEYGAPEGQEPVPAVLVAVGTLMDAGLLVSDETRVQRRDDVAWVDREDRVYALALGDLSAQPRLLADAAAVIWDWLEEPTTVTQLAARATEESAVFDPRVAADVEAYVADLVDSLLARELPAVPPGA